MHRLALTGVALSLAGCASAARMPAGTALSTGRLSYAAAITDRSIVAAELTTRFELISYDRTTKRVRWRRDLGPAEHDVNAIATTEDAVWVALDDGTVRSYRLEDGQAIVAWHLGAAATAVAANDKFVITGSEAGVLCLRRSRDGALLQCLVGHRGEITDLAVKDERVASSGQDGLVALWSLPALAPLQSTTVTGSANAISFSPDGRLAIATSARPLVRTPAIARREARGFEGVDPDARVLIWRPGRAVQVRLGHRGPVTDVAWLDKQRLLSSSWDRTVMQWPETGPPRVVGRFGNLVRSLASSGAMWVACAWSSNLTQPATWAVQRPRN